MKQFLVLQPNEIHLRCSLATINPSTNSLVNVILNYSEMLATTAIIAYMNFCLQKNHLWWSSTERTWFWTAANKIGTV